MPELPEVETVKEKLKPRLINKRVINVEKRKFALNALKRGWIFGVTSQADFAYGALEHICIKKSWA